jgi:AbrB family looped-hinge helix DNA binding protein
LLCRAGGELTLLLRDRSEYANDMAKPLIDVVQIGRRGEIVLPRRIRQGLGLQEGDHLVVTVEDRRLVFERRARKLGAYLDVLATAGAARDD